MGDDVCGFREFEFDLPSALLDQLVKVLEVMEDEILSVAGLEPIPNAQGIYQLFYKGDLVYIGKTDAEAGLRHRLERHARKVVHRSGILPADLTFKAVQILVFSAMDLETALIRTYDETGRSANWNKSGFGANDPGRNRDNSIVKPDHFDALFSIDIDRPLELKLRSTVTAAEYLSALRAAVPYVLRFEGAGKGRQPHAELAKTVLAPSIGLVTTRSAIKEIVSKLPTGWQATKLSGYVILYKEHRAYAHGKIIARS